MEPQPIPTQMRGMPQQQPQTGAPVQGSLMGDFMDAERLGGWNRPQQAQPQEQGADILAKIREKQSRLAEIDALIADIDRQYPELKNGGKEWEIAAKRAEIGDMSAYDSMMARGQQAGNASAIEGELKNAEKLTWGLSAKSDEDRAMARNQIEVALRSAEEWQAKTGQKLPDSYYRLKAALDNSGASKGGLNAREYANDLALKIYRGTASDEDVEKGIAWAEENPNSEEAKMILEAAQAARGKTIEAKGKRTAKQMKADEAAKNWDTNRDVSVKRNEWNKLVKAKAPITLFYKLNEYGNPVPKGGM